MLLKTQQKSVAITIVVAVLIFLAALTYFSNPALKECLPLSQFIAKIHPAYATPISFPIDLKIVSSKSPIFFDRKIKLEAIVVALTDTKDETIYLTIDLPKQLELVDGQTSWVGHLLRNDEKTLNFTVQAIESGEWIVKAQVDYGYGYVYGISTQIIVRSNWLCTTARLPEQPKIPAQQPVLKVVPSSPLQPEPSYDPRGKRIKP